MVVGNVNFDIQPLLDEINDGKSAVSLSFRNLVYKKYLEARSVSDFNTLRTGITCGDKIGFIDLGNSYSFMKSAEGLASGCDYNECDVEVTTSVKKWETHQYNCESKFCKNDIECAFKDWFGLNCEVGDDTSDAFISFLVDWYAAQLQRSHWRNVWFSDSSLAPTSSLFGGDGQWIQTVAAATNSGNVVAIPENANTTYATQMALAPQRGFEVYSALQRAATKNRQLRGRRNELVIYTTEDLALNYLDYLRDNNQVNCCFKSDVTQNVYDLQNLNIYGMPIRIVHEWDDIIQGGEFAELDNGTAYVQPHRALLTYKDNIPFGTCDAEMLDEVKLVYDMVSENLHLRSKYDIATSVIFEEEVLVAI